MINIFLTIIVYFIRAIIIFVLIFVLITFSLMFKIMNRMYFMNFRIFRKKPIDDE